MPARLFVKIPVPVIMHIPPPQIFFSYTRSLVNGNRGWNFFKDAHDRKILLSRAEHYALEPGYKKKLWLTFQTGFALGLWLIYYLKLQGFFLAKEGLFGLLNFLTF